MENNLNWYLNMWTRHVRHMPPFEMFVVQLAVHWLDGNVPHFNTAAHAHTGRQLIPPHSICFIMNVVKWLFFKVANHCHPPSNGFSMCLAVCRWFSDLGELKWSRALLRCCWEDTRFGQKKLVRKETLKQSGKKMWKSAQVTGVFVCVNACNKEPFPIFLLLWILLEMFSGMFCLPWFLGRDLRVDGNFKQTNY